MKSILLSLFAMLSMLFFSCSGKSDKSLAAENERLKQRMQNDSIVLADLGNEMTEVDEAINKILELTGSVSTGGSQSEKKQKVKEIEALIQSSVDKIAKLEQDLKQSNSSLKNSAALMQSLEAQKKMIAEQQKEIERLTGEVIVLKESNQTLKTSNENLSETVDVQSSKINSLGNDVNVAQQRLGELNRQISSANGNMDAINKQINKEYFAIARTLTEMAEDRKGVFKNAKEQRKSMTVKAMQYYCKLHERGVYEALAEISSLQGHAELGKYVKNESCESIKNR